MLLFFMACQQTVAAAAGSGSKQRQVKQARLIFVSLSNRDIALGQLVCSCGCCKALQEGEVRLLSAS
jgi:hypothetical protein